MYGLALITAPTDEPVTVAEARQQVSLPAGYTVHDELLSKLITAARETVEEATGRQLCTATRELTLDTWPEGHVIKLPRPPLASVTTVKYYDTSGVQQTWSNANYLVRTAREPGEVHKYKTVTWPTLQDRPDAVAVRYVCGTGRASVPSRARAVVLLLVAHWFENREAVITGTIATELPMAAAALLEQLRVGEEFTEYACG